MSAYEPKTGDVITINLPDEVTRATIIRMVSATAAIAELMNFTTASKSHNYKKGDLVPCKFGRTITGLKGWTVVSENELQASAKPEEVKPDPIVVREATHADIFGKTERKSKGKTSAALSG